MNVGIDQPRQDPMTRTIDGSFGFGSRDFTWFVDCADFTVFNEKIGDFVQFSGGV
jgi:hypothetical protein